MPLGGLAALSSPVGIVRRPGPGAEARAVELERRGQRERGGVHAGRAAAQAKPANETNSTRAERVGTLGQQQAADRPGASRPPAPAAECAAAA